MPEPVEFLDSFEGRVAPGRVIGSPADPGLGPAARSAVRMGADVEGVISVRNRALRFAPLVEPGWGRCGYSTEPLLLVPGTVARVGVMNAHPSSETLPLEPLRTRLSVWVRGSGTDPLPRRIAGLVSGRRRETHRRRLRRWFRHHHDGHRRFPASINQLVGFFDASTIDGPRSAIAAIATRPLGPRNGGFSLAVGALDLRQQLVDGLANAPHELVFVVRDDTVLLAASGLGGSGLAAAPDATPLGVVHRTLSGPVSLGVHQSVVSQHGFSIDTVVDRFELRHEARWADRFAGSSAGAVDVEGRRTFELPQAAGLIDLCVDVVDDREVSMTWPGKAGGVRTLVVGTTRVRLTVDGRAVERPLAPASSRHLSVNELEGRLRIHVDGQTLIDVAVDAPGPGSLVVETTSSGRDAAPDTDALPSVVRRLEIFGREIDLGTVVGRSWPSIGGEPEIFDDFTGPDSPDLEHRGGPIPWARVLGSTPIGTRDGRATIRGPLTERTVYLTPWSDPRGADVEVLIEPPEAIPGVLPRCRGGLVAGTGPDDLIIVNGWIDQSYGGGSISSFVRLGGREEVFDAVWANVGSALAWDRPFRLRLITDGMRYRVLLDGRTVLARSLLDIYPWAEPLALRQVGIVANWEWGLDTGSRFRDFTGRRLRESPSAPQPATCR